VKEDCMGYARLCNARYRPKKGDLVIGVCTSRAVQVLRLLGPGNSSGSEVILFYHLSLVHHWMRKVGCSVTDSTNRRRSVSTAGQMKGDRDGHASTRLHCCPLRASQLIPISSQYGHSVPTSRWLRVNCIAARIVPPDFRLPRSSCYFSRGPAYSCHTQSKTTMRTRWSGEQL
jgi:hypothetical protein